MKEFKKALRDIPACGYMIIAVAMILIILMAGCATTYSMTITKDPVTERITKVEAQTRSFREAAMFRLIYNPTTGYFEILAVGVTDDTSEVVGKAVGVVGDVAKAAINPVGALRSD